MHVHVLLCLVCFKKKLGKDTQVVYVSYVWEIWSTAQQLKKEKWDTETETIRQLFYPLRPPKIPWNPPWAKRALCKTLSQDKRRLLERYFCALLEGCHWWSKKMYTSFLEGDKRVKAQAGSFFILNTLFPICHQNLWHQHPRGSFLFLSYFLPPDLLRQ